MGKSLSVLKSNRQSQRKKEMNFYYKDLVRKYRKNIRKMIDKKEEKQSIMDMYKLYVSMVDKALKKNIFHKNTAARKKSRINLLIKNHLKNN